MIGPEVDLSLVIVGQLGQAVFQVGVVWEVRGVGVLGQAQGVVGEERERSG